MFSRALSVHESARASCSDTNMGTAVPGVARMMLSNTHCLRSASSLESPSAMINIASRSVSSAAITLRMQGNSCLATLSTAVRLHLAVVAVPRRACADCKHAPWLLHPRG
eukprot:5745319-Pleurochrysis_carterae.AAC.1